jgi:hypothetical protein
MVKFEQAYWYTHVCPLRKIEKKLFPEKENALIIRKYIHTAVLSLFKNYQKDLVKDVLPLLDIKRLKRGINSATITKQVHKALINIGIWRVKHQDEEILLQDFSKEVEGMSINIDIARLKSNMRQTQLIWFRYDFLMPSLSDFAKLVEKAQWNARGYELLSGNRPMQLTYYFPVLGVEYSVLYNTEGKYEVIADLINKGVYPMQPSLACDYCTECPMSWVGYKGELK